MDVVVGKGQVMPLFKRKRFDSAPIFTVGDDSFIVKRAEAGSTGALLDIQDETGASLFTVGNDGVVGPITVTTGSIELGTGTTGDYVEALNAGTGVSITNNSGEGAIPTVAIGQAVGTTDSPSFSGVTAGNISIGVVTDNKISGTGSLVLHSSSGSVEIDGAAYLTGGIQVNGSIEFNTSSAGNNILTNTNGNPILVYPSTKTGNKPTGNDVTVRGSDATGTSTATGGYARIYGGNGTSTNGGTSIGGSVLIDSGQGDTGEISIGNNYATTIALGRASATPQVLYVHSGVVYFYGDVQLPTLSVSNNLTINNSPADGYIKWDATYDGTLAWPTVTDNRTINLPDASGTVAILGTIALGTDTTGDYVSSLVAGTGVTLTNNSGESATPTIAIGQAVGTTDNVEFHDVTVTGDLTVTGTLNTVNETNLAIEDAFIYLNDGSTISNPDLGIAGNYNDGSYKHAGIFRDATDGTWKFFQGYTEEPGADINVAHASYADAPVKALSATLTQSTGTAPLTVSSTTKVSNLNADLLDDQEGSWYSPPGMITMYGGSSAPSGWIICDGSAVSRTTYSSLYAVIGTTYGSGDGSTTFNVPNLNGRVAVGFNSSDTSFDTLGEVGGHKETQSHTHDGASHTHTGTTATEGAHTHTYSDYSQDGGAAVNFGTQYTVGGPVVTTRTTSAGSAHSHTFTTSAPAAVGTTGSYGGGNAGNLQPYIVLNYIIKI